MPYDEVFTVLACLAGIIFILWCAMRIRYVIDDRHLRVVRILRKTGIFRNFIITPQDRDTFIRELKAKVPNLPS